MDKNSYLYRSNSLVMVTIIKKGTSLSEIKKLIDKALSKNKKESIMDYAGKLKTSIDPLQYQKEIRDEWK